MCVRIERKMFKKERGNLSGHRNRIGIDSTLLESLANFWLFPIAQTTLLQQHTSFDMKTWRFTYYKDTTVHKNEQVSIPHTRGETRQKVNPVTERGATQNI
jgi:hypothetical protein